MRFNADMYDELFPREAVPAAKPEVPVETITNQKSEPEQPVAEPGPELPEEGDADGNSGSGESTDE